MNTLLQVSNLACKRGDRTLFHGIDFSVDASQICQIVGANGSGKTSLLTILTGLLPPTAGVVQWQGRHVLANDLEYHAQLNYLAHEPAVKAVFTPWQNLQFSLHTESASENALREALAYVALNDDMHIPCNKLSRGQRQRVALARLYLNPKKIWILDEPFTALDPDGFATLQQLIENHCERGGLVIFASHRPVAFRHLSAVQTVELLK